jgi:all-trans-retinol dehydrogenase (NAD+)
MSILNSWLPREGFTLDVVQDVILKTVLNPYIVLPLLVLSSNKGPASLSYPQASGWLKICAILGLIGRFNGWLSQNALNNWTKARFDWEKELVLITGGSDGFGKLLTLGFSKNQFAGKNVKIIVLDIQDPTYDLRGFQKFFLENS